jgi:hypothetical protein
MVISSNRLWALFCFFGLSCGGTAFVDSGEGGVPSGTVGGGGAAGAGGSAGSTGSGGAGGSSGIAGAGGIIGAGGSGGIIGSGGAGGIIGSGGAGGVAGAGGAGAIGGSAGAGGFGGHGGIAGAGGSTGGAGGSTGGAGGSTGGAGGSTGGAGGAGGAGGTGGAGGISIDAGVDWYACSGPGQCSLLSNRCCAACEPAPLSAFTGVNTKYSGAYKESLGCGGIACSPCVLPTDPTKFNTPQYMAHCLLNRCATLDVRESAASKCTIDADCALRWGLGCCEGCGGTTGGLVAVNRSGELRAMVCGPGPIACPACMPVYPANVSARCMPSPGSTVSHCRVAYDSTSVDGG